MIISENVLKRISEVIPFHPVAVEKDWIIVTIPEEGAFNDFFNPIEEKINSIKKEIESDELLIISVRRSNQTKDIWISKYES